MGRPCFSAFGGDQREGVLDERIAAKKGCHLQPKWVHIAGFGKITLTKSAIESDVHIWCALKAELFCENAVNVRGKRRKAIIALMAAKTYDIDGVLLPRPFKIIRAGR